MVGEINISDEKVVMDLFNKCIQMIDTRVDNFVIRDFQKIASFFHYLYILSKYIKMEDIPYHSEIKRQVLINTINKVKKYKAPTVYKIKQRINIELLDYLHEEKEFIVAFQLLVNEKSFPIKKISIDGYKFKIIDKRTFFDKYQSPEIDEIQTPDVYESLNKDYLIMYTSIKAQHHDNAYNSLNDKFEFLRCLLNFWIQAYSYPLPGGVTFSFPGDQPKPLSAIQLPKFILIYNKEKEFLRYYYNLQPVFEPKIVLSDERLKLIRKYLKGQNQMIDTELKDVYKLAIRLYGAAIDNYQEHYQLLYFWQIFEVILRKDEKEKSKKVIQRLKVIFSKTEYINELLEIIKTYRNSIAHKGIDIYLDEHDILLIRKFVESLISYLYYRCTKYRTKNNLLYFLDNYNLPNKDIKSQSNILQSIIHKRS